MLVGCCSALELGARHVYCYEPDPDNFALLRANMEHNGLVREGRVSLFNEAITGDDDDDDGDNDHGGNGGGEGGGEGGEGGEARARPKEPLYRPLYKAVRTHMNGYRNNYRHSLLATKPGGTDTKRESVPVQVTPFAEVLRRHGADGEC